MSRRDEVEQNTQELAEQSQELAKLDPAVVEAFRSIMEAIPEADSSQAMLRIVASVLSAERAEELEEPWNGEGLRNLIGRRLRINEVRRLPSEFMSGPGWYLGCDAVLVETGQTKFVTTGSISVLAQLGRAVQAGWLPLEVVPRVPERPSKNGYFPMHLEIVRRQS